jgi:hypothetical protein
VTLAHNLFSFSQPDVYQTLNNPKATDTEIENLVEKIANSLFSVILTLGILPSSFFNSFYVMASLIELSLSLTDILQGEIPIIRCPRGNAAELVAQKLDQKIRQHISNPRTNLFQEVDPVNFQRPGKSLLFIKLVFDSENQIFIYLYIYIYI